MATKHDRAILNCVFSPLFPFSESNDEIVPEELKDPESYSAPTLAEVEELEISAIEVAEKGDIAKAITLFSEVIDKTPLRAAGYNNRAQTYRLKGDIEDALKDLESAIEVSNGTGKSACLAFCQRGLIYRLQKQEEKARGDFQKASNMGSKLAATYLVQMNSYAALCNDMLNKVLAMQQNLGSEKNITLYRNGE